jgi:glutathione S-transferase
MRAPMIVYGSKISYFTGKFEAYLRYREIPYELRAIDPLHYGWIVPRALGAAQLPTVRLADGRWMSDTTPMIAWLERGQPSPSVIPADPVVGYVALLVGDYADEWLWRPAMHYRWSHEEDRHLAATRLSRELLNVPLPLAARRRWIARRQTRLFVAGDGVDATTAPHAEGAFRRALACLEPVLSKRPFLLGERPTIADLGLMGPFWRHFVHDPTPARIMQDSAPATFEWAARTWNARAGHLGSAAVASDVPRDLFPLLREIGASHLPALAVNAEAHRAGAPVHRLELDGAAYRRVPTSAYRVWCLERLQERFRGLGRGDAAAVEELLREHGCWKPLWRAEGIRSGHDPRGEAPFCRVTRMVRD